MYGQAAKKPARTRVGPHRQHMGSASAVIEAIHLTNAISHGELSFADGQQVGDAIAVDVGNEGEAGVWGRVVLNKCRLQCQERTCRDDNLGTQSLELRELDTNGNRMLP